MLGFAIQLGVVYPLVLVLVGRRNPWTFFRGIEAAMLTAFGTSSSNATLPVSLRVAEERLGLPPAIARFVLTVGATGNQNGTALFEGVVVLFLAQVFGVDLSLGQQITVVLLAVLAGVGTAGVPGWIDSDDRAGSAEYWCAGRIDRHHLGHRSHLRHVPHGTQRHR